MTLIKNLLVFMGVMLFAGTKAQTYIERNLSGTTANSSQFGATTAKRVQQLYTPADLGSPVASGPITEVYFMYNTTTAQSFTDLEVYIGQTTNTTLTTNMANNFTDANMISVRSVGAFTIPAGTAGAWFAIPLTTNFNYDPSKSLVVETRWTTNPTSTTWQNQVGANDGSGTNKKAIGTTATATTGTLSVGRANFRFKLFAANDAGVSSITAPLTPSSPGVNNVNVNITNYSTATITSADINWTVDGVSQSPYSWAGSLAPGATANVTIGSYNFPSGTHTFTASTSMPNGLTDGNTANDQASASANFCTPILPVVTVDQGSPPSASNFTTFTELATRLSECGITGNVTVNVLNGPYTEQVVFNAIPGAGAGARVTINGNGNILTANTDATNRYIMRLANVSYVTIDNLNIQQGTFVTGWMGIQLYNSGSNVVISNCQLTAAASTSVLVGGIIGNGDPTSFTTGGNFSNIRVTKTNVTGPGKGIQFYGTTTTLASNIVIDSNTVVGTGSDGIFISATSGAQVHANTIQFTLGDGIEIYQNNSNALAYNNKISVTNAASTSTFKGITVSTSSTGAKVYNNLIWNMNATAGNIYGMSANSATEFYHNTVILDDNSATGQLSVGFFEESTTSGCTLKNNIFYVTRPASAWSATLALGNASNVVTALTSNNNTFWITGGSIAVKRAITTANAPTTLYPTLSDWSTASGDDVASFSTNPTFQSGTAIPTSGIINGQGATGLGISTDITGTTRTSPPDPGAYEFSPASDDAAITGFVTPTLPYCATNLDVQFTLTNAGAAPLNTATINWTVNGVPQTVVNWAGPSIAAGASATVTLGNVPVTGSNTYSFSATVTSPNGNADANAANNSFTYNGFRRGMNGTFTIDKTSPITSTNYQTFQSLSNDLSLYGICDDVTIDVVGGTGPYTQQVTFNAIPGSSSTNTVTLNGNNETLQFTAVSAFPLDFTLKLSNVNFFTVQNLHVKALDATNANGIYITSNSSDVTIQDNLVEVSKTATGSTTFGIIAAGATSYLLSGSLSQNLLITRNTIIGGYSGIQLTGNAFTSVSTKLRNSIISKNTIQDFYGYGINMNYVDNIQVDSNLISRPTRTNSGSDSQTPAGIIANSGSTNFTLERNTISNLYNSFMNATELAKIARGIYVSGTATATTNGTIKNNLIYGFINTGTQYGIQNNSLVGPINFYHNTIALNHTGNTGTNTASTVALYFSNSSAQNGADVRNNIFYITRGGTSNKKVIDVDAAGSSFTCNYNVLYIGSTQGTNLIAQSGPTDYATFAGWQGTGKDINSSSVDPVFVDESNGNFEATNYLVEGGYMGTPNVGVALDIRDTVRSVNPDPGAFEFALPLCSAPPVAGAATSTILFPCSGESFTLNLTGNSSGNAQTYQWQSSPDHNVWTDITSPVNTPAFTTSQTANSYYRAIVVCNNGTPVISDSIYIELTTPLAGSYNIDKSIPTGGINFASFNDAVYAMRCGISGPVTFNVVPGSGPYNEQVIIGQITGASPANTITFYGNGESLNFISTSSVERAVIKLNGADYITIDGLIINCAGTTTGQYGYGIQMLNNADNNTIVNCTINSNLNLATSNYAGIMINSSASGAVTTTGNSGCDNNIISGNTIVGGNVGIALVANGSTSQITGNQVINNTVQDFYNHGIYLNGGVNTLIEGNDISRPGRPLSSISTFYGINMVGNSVGTQVSKNRIHGPFKIAPTSTSDAYGIKLNNANALLGSETTISNNLVYDFVNAGDEYGININGGDYTKLYHNTISLEDMAASCASCLTRGVFVESATLTGLDLRNNIFAISRGGSGEKQSLYFTPTSISGYTINNNVHFMNPSLSGTHELAHIGSTSYADLTAWQATGKDVNGSAADPIFTDAPNGDFTPMEPSVDNLGTAVGVITDILNNPRDLTTPDPGAFEFTNPLPVTLSMFKGEIAGQSNKLMWITSTEINNKGFELQRSADGRSFSSITFVATKADNGNSSIQQDYFYMDGKPLTGNSYYRLKQVDRDGKYNYSNVILLSRKVKEIQLSAVYPNPAIKQLSLVINSPAQEKLTIIITDLTGKIIIKQAKSVVAGENQLQLDVQPLAAGTYLVKMVCANGCETAVQRFVKQ